MKKNQGLSHHKKMKKKDIAFYIILYSLFGIFTLLCIYPFYYLFINSISANNLSAAGKIILLPHNIHLSNYVKVLKIRGLGHAAFISVSRTVLGPLATVLVSAFLGFMFTQDEMFLKKFFYRFTILTMYFGAGLIPWYLTMRNLGLTNNFLAYVIPGAVSPFNIILVKTYIESTPKELQEAAKIDGANILTIFGKIVFPLAKPILATVSIFSMVGAWNAFQDTLLLMTDEKYYTLQYVLYRYMNEASSVAKLIQSSQGTAVNLSQMAQTSQTPTSVKMTVSMFVIIPVLMIYPYFQKFFVKGIMIGSIKG